MRFIMQDSDLSCATKILQAIKRITSKIHHKKYKLLNISSLILKLGLK